MRLGGSGHLNAAPKYFHECAFHGCIWPRGIARQGSCNRYFIFVTVGTKEGSHHFIPGGSRGGGCSMGHEKLHFSISEAQLRRTESGAELGWSTLVAIRNLCPSSLTS
jgi:hypothetical protein